MTQSETKHTGIGTIRVCDPTDYASHEIMVEEYGYVNGRLGWSVPAWEEQGFADLAGPFVSADAARAAIARAMEG